MVKEQEIKTPEFTFYRNVGPEDLQEIFDDTPIPCVVKTPTGGSSVGVFIVRDEDALRDALNACLSMGSSVLIEELIEGREFTCGVLRGKALPSVEIRPLVRFYDYTNKYMAGATEEICPGRTTPEVEKRIGDTALAVHTILGLRTYSRSDFIVTDDNEVYFLEVNTLPGMTDTSLVPQEAAAVGISYGELCEMILEDGLRKYRSSLDQVLEN
jgi:D-alanine-D-alanine ligase